MHSHFTFNSARWLLSQSLLQVSDTESTASDGVKWWNVKLRGSGPERKRALELEPGDDGRLRLPEAGVGSGVPHWWEAGWEGESPGQVRTGDCQWCSLHNQVLCWSQSSWRRKMGLLWDLWARKVMTWGLWGSERWRTGMSERYSRHVFPLLLSPALSFILLSDSPSPPGESSFKTHSVSALSHAFPAPPRKGGNRSLLQGIFLTQGSNPSLLDCRWILYHWAIGEAREYLYHIT